MIRRIISLLIAGIVLSGVGLYADDYSRTLLQEEARERIEKQIVVADKTPEVEAELISVKLAEPEEITREVEPPEITEKEKWDFITQKFDVELMKRFNHEKASLVLSIIGILVSTGVGIGAGTGANKLLDDTSTAVLCGGVASFAMLAIMARFQDWVVSNNIRFRDTGVMNEFLAEWETHKKMVPNALNGIFEHLHQLYQDGKDVLAQEPDIVQVIRDGVRGRLQHRGVQ